MTLDEAYRWCYAHFPKGWNRGFVSPEQEKDAVYSIVHLILHEEKIPIIYRDLHHYRETTTIPPSEESVSLLRKIRLTCEELTPAFAFEALAEIAELLNLEEDVSVWPQVVALASPMYSPECSASVTALWQRGAEAHLKKVYTAVREIVSLQERLTSAPREHPLAAAEDHGWSWRHPTPTRNSEGDLS